MIAGLAQRHRKGYIGVMDTKFKKGFTPWNKGTKGIMKANATSFQKGHGAIPLEERFGIKVIKGEMCWIWAGSLNNKGYGRINVEGKIELAHRIAYQFRNGPIPNGMTVMHTCDNPRCVNPAHLKLGTQLENMHDMDAKGRRIKGEDASWSKLNWEQVSEIRNLYANGDISMRALAKKFNISYTVINHIIHKKLWK